MEKIVYNQLHDHLLKSDLLDPLQTGFRRGNSTQTALLKLTDDVRLAWDHRMVTLLILFDFSKTFDTVDHLLLMSKLTSFLLSGQVLAWIASYLSGRSQAVINAEGGHSDWLPTSLYEWEFLRVVSWARYFSRSSLMIFPPY